MKKNIILSTLILLMSWVSIAQNRTITGIVSTFEDEQTLPGVTVMIKGTATGTTTDFEGRYKLTGVVQATVLVFSFVGYIPQEIIVGEQQMINVALKSDIQKLEGVVVTALGVKRQKREIGYSTEVVNTDDIVRSSSSNVINAIVGRTAGVMVTQSNGVEGGTSRITIRGNNNLTGNNQPLIVVDNVPMENSPGLESIGRGIDWGNGISDLNSFDIETYNVLKGGAASALYGARGANGVILITTKRGKKQQGIGITYNFEHKIVHPYRFREVQNKYGHAGPITLSEPYFPVGEDGVLEYPGTYSVDKLVINQAGTTRSSNEEFGYYGSAVSWGPEMKGQIIRWWDGEMRDYSPQPDNLKAPYHDGFTQTHNIEANAGNESGTLRISLTRQDHKPIIDNSNFNRTTINLGSSLKISKKLNADVVMTYVKFNRLNSPIMGDDGNSFSKGYLYSWPRSYKGIDKENYQLADGSQNKLEGFPFRYVDKQLWWNFYNNNTRLNRDKYSGALTLTYNVTNWLSATGRVGRDYTIEQYETRKKPIDVIGLEGGGYANSLSKSYSDNYEFTLTAQKKQLLGSDFNIVLTTGTSRWDHDLYAIYGHSGVWYYPNMYTFLNYTETVLAPDTINPLAYNIVQTGNSAGSVIAAESINRKRNNSVYAFLNLDYKTCLFIQLTGRNDWSSTLPSDNNSYFYPSISASFVASEAFQIQKKIPWINFVKIRGGVSQTASDADPYSTYFFYNNGRFGGEQTSYFPGTIPPFKLKPQRVNSYEGGLNLGFFKDRIEIDFTAYYKYSFDQILELYTPVSAGAQKIKINEGELSNKGFDLAINTVPILTPSITLKAGFNFSRNRNYIESFGDYSDSYPLADIWGLHGPAMELREGDEYGVITGYDYIYNDKGERVLNDEGTKYLITDTRVPIGNASPDFVGGFNTELSYKNFTLRTLIDTKWGGDIYCGSYVISLQTGQSPSTLLERDGGGLPYTDPEGNVRNVGVILDGVYADGTKNDKVVHYLYKYLPNAGGWGKIISTPGIIENTWVKMREISLSYTLPQNILTKIKIFQKLTLSIVGRDLFYIYTTLPDNINPEGIMGSGNAQGFEWASYPGTRSFTFSANAAF